METRDLLLFETRSTNHSSALGSQLAGWSVKAVSDLARARTLAGSGKFRVGLASLDLSAADAAAMAQRLITPSTRMEWIALLPRPCLESGNVRELICDAFYDYHTLPADTARLQITLGRAYGIAQMKQTALAQSASWVGETELVSASPDMQALARAIHKVAAADAPVLITGESGTGKELTAQAIHKRSPRARGPFVAVNCATFPATLIQSELFGHEKGAFTDAYRRQTGRIEAAGGGHLFLDEIGDLPLPSQANLLRFLQEKTIERLGGSEPIPVDVRVIAATNVDLEQAVEAGRFREDLFYRLNVLRLYLPALRQRRDDIEPLAHFFFAKFANEQPRHPYGFSPAALARMRSHDWPGNVRELINRVRRAMVMCEGRFISPADLGLEQQSSEQPIATLTEARAQAEREAISNALDRARHNVSKAARELAVSRLTLYRLMGKYGIQNCCPN